MTKRPSITDTAKKKSGVKHLNRLATEEWLAFRDCPENEKSYCLIYELAREVAREVPAITPQHFLPEYGQLVKLFPDWQRKPWLTWEQTYRTNQIIVYRKAYEKDVELAFHEPMNQSVHLLKNASGKYQNERELYREYNGFIYGRARVFVHFIDWKQPDKRLLQEFNKWLQARRPEAPEGNKRKTTPTDELKWLAARRLLQAFGHPRCHTEAIMMLGSKNDDYLYKGPSTWYRAKRSCDKSVEGVRYDALFDHETGKEVI